MDSICCMFYVCSTKETTNFHFIVPPSIGQGQISFLADLIWFLDSGPVRTREQLSQLSLNGCLKDCWSATGSLEVCSDTHQCAWALLMTPVAAGGALGGWWYIYVWGQLLLAPSFSLIQFLFSSLPNPDKRGTDTAKSGSMHTPNADRLTGVPATVKSVLCDPQCPTWWCCGRRLLRTAASGQGPTTELLYYLKQTE